MKFLIITQSPLFIFMDIYTKLFFSHSLSMPIFYITFTYLSTISQKIIPKAVLMGFACVKYIVFYMFRY